MSLYPVPLHAMKGHQCPRRGCLAWQFSEKGRTSSGAVRSWRAEGKSFSALHSFSISTFYRNLFFVLFSVLSS